MLGLRTAVLLALCLTSPAAIAQDGQPATGATTTFQIELAPGSNLVALPLLPDSVRMGAVLAGVLPNLTFVQDDAGRYFIPVQGIDGIGTWAWNEAYKIEVSSPTSFFIEGAAILPEASPLLIDGEVGNWVPYFRRAPMAVEEAFASIAAALSRVEAADGRFYYPGDASSTLDSLRTGQGYKVWVSQPATLTYPPNPAPPGEEDTTPPSAPTGLTAAAGNGRVTLGWNDNTEGDLAGSPYTVKRSGTAGGPYAPIASPGQSAYTDGTVANGTTYYYVVTAIDGSGNESAPSVERAATPQASTGLFALPASPTPTATDEAIGMRAMFRDDPKGFNNHVSTAYDGATTQGERLWIGIGGVGYNYTHPAVAVEPDGAGGIVTEYVTSAGVLYDLPPLGTQIGTSGYPRKLYMSHEGTDMGAVVDYPDGSSAVHILVMDGLGAPYLSYRFTEDANGVQRTDTLTIDGVNFSSFHKHHALDVTKSGMVVMHATDNDVNAPWPNLIVNRDMENGGDADFFRPGTDYTAPRRLTLKVGAIGDTVYVVTNEDPAYSIVRAVGRLRVRRDEGSRRGDVLGRGVHPHQRVRRYAPLHRPGGREPRLRALQRVGKPTRLPQRRLRLGHPGRRGLGLRVPARPADRGRSKRRGDVARDVPRPPRAAARRPQRWAKLRDANVGDGGRPRPPGRMGASGRLAHRDHGERVGVADWEAARNVPRDGRDGRRHCRGVLPRRRAVIRPGSRRAPRAQPQRHEARHRPASSGATWGRT